MVTMVMMDIRSVHLVLENHMDQHLLLVMWLAVALISSIILAFIQKME